MKVFLTGSTGFVGSHVAREYVAAGAELRLLTRSTSKLAAIEGLAAEVVVGDLRQPEALRTAIRGCDALVHVAADYRLWVRDPKEMYATNVDGTRELLRIAREEGVAKVVYTSSVATMGFKTDGTIVDENTPVSIADMIGPYKRSKFMAEQEAISAARSGQRGSLCVRELKCAELYTADKLCIAAPEKQGINSHTVGKISVGGTLECYRLVILKTCMVSPKNGL